MKLRKRDERRRGEVLIFFAVLDLVYCYGLLTPPEPLPPQYVWMERLLPLWVWAGCWAAVGLLCLASAFLHHDTIAFTAAMAIKVGWGLLSLIGWATGNFDRGYLSAVIWLGFAYFVYRVAGGIPPPAPSGKAATWKR